MKALVLSLLLTAGMLTACGPQEPSAQKDNDQINQLVAQETAKYVPIVGTYVGTMTDPDGTVEQVELTIVPMTQPSVNSSRFGTTPVPTVGGTLFICMNVGSCFTDKKLAADPASKFVAGQFTSADYEPKTQHLHLFFGAAVSPSVGGASSSSNAQIYIDGIASGDEIKGNYTATAGATLAPIDVKKVD